MHRRRDADADADAGAGAGAGAADRGPRAVRHARYYDSGFSHERAFPIADFGARQTDRTRTSAALAQAIDAAHSAESGIVVLPEGLWPTGKII